jgi:hypothetical protein
MPIFPTNPFGNWTGRCIACGRDAGLKGWHSRGDLLCWPCWLRVEHLGEDAEARRFIFDAIRLWRAGHVESASADEIDVLVALGMVAECA